MLRRLEPFSLSRVWVERCPCQLSLNMHIGSQDHTKRSGGPLHSPLRGTTLLLKVFPLLLGFAVFIQA